MKLLNTAKKITTAAALAAALLAGTAPKAAAQCPYTVGPLGRYIVPAFSAAVVAPVQGCFCCLPKGSDSSLNGISLQW